MRGRESLLKFNKRGGQNKRGGVKMPLFIQQSGNTAKRGL